ncbi:hypothetical protein SAMN04487898_11744 [Pedobacter sp. ok626]|uniref:hypothetical protein n=1 Tax=Pedobacter sp. ok626 TaxID=1761882 RepID=UPI00088B1150|nr:hypothetical protein [Pedobacter sp. ok626]SDL31317.1 hypothetical protein SAMN04487898_11744 [Pedobacter sp. ok626]
MRKLYHTGIFMILCIVAVSCKKEPVEILTLSKAGEEFYFGEKVKVWAGTEGGDNTTVSYKWSATGGTFDGWRTQNLFENLWIAPAAIGEYTVTATANRDGGASSSRTTNLKVTRYFFDEFQSKFTFDGNGWANSDITFNQVADNDPLKSRFELTSATVNKTGVFRRDLNLADLRIPLSVRAKLGWKSFFRAGQPIIVSLFFKQPSANPNYPFLREIRWEYYPTVDPATTDSYQIRYETFTPASGKSTFSTNTAVLPAPLPLINPIKGKSTLFKSGDNVEKSIAFAIDANNVFTTYVDGVQWFSSNGIKDWLAYCKTTYPGFEAPLASRFQVAYPGRANANETGTTGFLKSVYITNDGTILK